MEPTMLRDRPRPVQILLAGVVPAVVGAIAGILTGVSSGGYWAIAVLAGVGGVLAGFEHPDGWGGADRGLLGGFVYGLALFLTHEIAGAAAKVSLGSKPVLLPIVTAIIGMFLGALGGRLGRMQRERRAREPQEKPV